MAILSERRVVAPYGMKGGLPGQRGLNLWMRKLDDGSYQAVNVSGKAEFTVKVGDRFVISKSKTCSITLPDTS